MCWQALQRQVQQERVAAKQVLSEMTVADIRNNPVIAYEDDCVTRLIQDDVNETAYNQIKNWSISELREYVLSDETSVDDIAFTRKGLTSEVVAAVAGTPLERGPDLRREENAGNQKGQYHHRYSGHLQRPFAAK
ncbi:ethanolamine ammonia-lyase subunit EutB [Escherichia coli]